MDQGIQQDSYDDQNPNELPQDSNSKSPSKQNKFSPKRKMKKIEVPKRIITASLSESASDDKYKKQIEEKARADLLLSPKSQRKPPRKLEIPKQIINDPFSTSQDNLVKGKGKKRSKKQVDPSEVDHKEINLDLYVKDPNSTNPAEKKAQNKPKRQRPRQFDQTDTQGSDENMEDSHNREHHQFKNMQDADNPKRKTRGNQNLNNSPFSSNDALSNENKRNSQSPYKSNQQQVQQPSKANTPNQYSNRQISKQPSYNVGQPIEGRSVTDSNFTYDYLSLPNDFDQHKLEELIRRAKREEEVGPVNIPRSISPKIDNRRYQVQEQITVQSETWEDENQFEEEEEFYEGEYFLDEDEEDDNSITDQQEISYQYEEYEGSTYDDNYKSSDHESNSQSNSIHDIEENCDPSTYSNDMPVLKEYTNNHQHNHTHHHSHHQHTHTPTHKIDKNYFSASGKKLIRVKKYKNNPSPAPISSPFAQELLPQQEPSPKGIETRNKHQFASKIAFSDDELKERKASFNEFEYQNRLEENENSNIEEEEENDQFENQGSSINDDDILSFFQVSEGKWNNNRDTYNFFHLNDKNNNYSTASTKSVNEKSYSSKNNSKISNENSKNNNTNSKISNTNSKISNTNSKISNADSKINNNNSNVSNHNSKISSINTNSHNSNEDSQNISYKNKDDIKVQSSKLSNHSFQSHHSAAINSQLHQKSNENIQTKDISGNISNDKTNDGIKGIETVTSVYSQTSALPQKASNSRKNSELSQRSNRSLQEQQNSVHSSSSPKKCYYIPSQRVDEIVQTSIIEDHKDDEKTQTSEIENQKEDQNTQTTPNEDQKEHHSSSSSFLSVFSAISSEYRKDVQNYQQQHKSDIKLNPNSKYDGSFSIPYDPPDPRFIKRDVKIDDDIVDSILSESLSSGSERDRNKNKPLQSSKHDSIIVLEKVESDSNVSADSYSISQDLNVPSDEQINSRSNQNRKTKIKKRKEKSILNEQKQQSPQTPESASSHHSSNSESFHFSDQYANISTSSNPINSQFIKKKENSTSRIDISELSSNSQDKKKNCNQINKKLTMSPSNSNISANQDSNPLSDILRSETVTLNFPEVIPPDIWGKTSSGSGIKSKKSSEQSDSLKELVFNDSSSLEIQNGQLQPLQYEMKNSTMNGYNDENEIQNSYSAIHKNKVSKRNGSNDLDSNSISVTSNSELHISEVVDDLNQISGNVELNESALDSAVIPSSSASRNYSMSSESSHSKSGIDKRSHSKQKSKSKLSKKVIDGLSDVSAISDTSSAKNELSMSDFAGLSNKSSHNNGSQHFVGGNSADRNIVIVDFDDSNQDKKAQSSKLSFQTFSNISSNISGEMTDFTFESKDSLISEIKSNE